LLISGFLEGSDRDGTIAIEDVLHNMLVFLEKKTETAEPTLI
jgi:hypothetical protein